MRKEQLGSFALDVVLAVLHSGNRASAGEVREEINERTGKDVSIGAVFTTLNRLIDRKLVVESAAQGPIRRGVPRRFFRVTAAGRLAAASRVKEVFAMAEGVFA